MIAAAALLRSQAAELLAAADLLERVPTMEAKLRLAMTNLTERYHSATGVTAGTVADRAIKDNSFFARFEKSDKGFNVRTYDRIVKWLSDHWPDDLEWPAHIERPVVADTVAA